mmetsp:Transcript_41786/g.105366  ORF Transcript_41786/g.105366 Transcript_41786/m.105366 type:complete len:232 (-) Transcript_41786:976-1671(-)
MHNELSPVLQQANIFVVTHHHLVVVDDSDRCVATTHTSTSVDGERIEVQSRHQLVDQCVEGLVLAEHQPRVELLSVQTTHGHASHRLSTRSLTERGDSIIQHRFAVPAEVRCPSVLVGGMVEGVTVTVTVTELVLILVQVEGRHRVCTGCGCCGLGESRRGRCWWHRGRRRRRGYERRRRSSSRRGRGQGGGGGGGRGGESSSCRRGSEESGNNVAEQVEDHIECGDEHRQ